MLEGLEISVVSLSEVLQSSIMRIEPEFYNSARMHYSNCKKGEDVIVFSQYGTSKDLNEASLGYPVLRLNEFNYSFISAPAKYCNLIDESTYQDLRLKKGDVLICRTNGNPKYVGKSALVAKDYDYAFASYLFRVRPDLSLISPATLVAYLNSKYGRVEIERYSMVSNQANFSPAKFREINIPILPKSVNDNIDNLTYSAFDKLEKSELLFTAAENDLLESLGLTDFAVNPEASNVKSFKDSFLASGRFDAEYYLPKYEDYVNLIRQYDGGADTIGNICEVKDSNFNPEANKKYRYIELANVGNFGNITGCSTMSGAELPSRARRIVHTGDVVVSSLEGSIDSCALIPQEFDGALCSTGFYVMKSDYLNPETLLILFKSLPVQQLMIRGCSGAIMSAISRTELDSIPLPLIQQDVQDEIARHMQKSLDFRQEAKNLLDEAQLTVEDAILLGGGKWLIYNNLQNNANIEYRIAMMILLDNINYPYCHTNPKRGVTYKSLSSSFAKSGRLDAEYYQPKYDRLSTYLSGFPCSTIGELTSIQKSVEPGSDAYQDNGIPFVRVQDLSKFGITETDVHLSEKDYATVIRPKKDTILLSKDGSVGIAYKVEEDINCITSGAILHITVKDSKVLPDYLALVLNSIIVKMQAERDAGGSIIQHWKPSEIENVVVPILPIQIQTKLSKIIQQSFALRKESKQLLQDARSLVENEISNNQCK